MCDGLPCHILAEHLPAGRRIETGHDALSAEDDSLHGVAGRVDVGRVVDGWQEAVVQGAQLLSQLVRLQSSAL